MRGLGRVFQAVGAGQRPWGRNLCPAEDQGRRQEQAGAVEGDEVARCMGLGRAGPHRPQGRHLIEKTVGAFGGLKHYFKKLF